MKSAMKNAMQKIKATLAFNRNDKEGNRQALFFLSFLFVGFAAVMPEMALAAPWDNAATQVLAIFTGGLTRTIAIICVIACGIAGLAGKLSWDWAIKIILGIVLIFGSTAIVDYIISASA